jgi:hypothetical protein
MDRAFWLAGVKQYMSANRATLVRQATKWNVKDFAGELGIEILDIPHIEELERNAGINPSLWIGNSDRDYFAARADEWNHGITSDAVTKELFFTLNGETRFHDPFGGISFLLHHLRALTRNLKEQRFASESLTRFLIAESVAQLSMFLMRVAEFSLLLSPDDRNGLIQKGLTYGHMDKPFVDRLFRNAKRITTEMIRHYTGKDVKVDDSYFMMPEPPNVNEVQEIVKLLLSRPSAASSFAQLTDSLIFERFLKQRDGIEWMAKTFPFSDLKERLSLVQDYLRILKSIEAIPDAALGTNKRAVNEANTAGRPQSTPTMPANKSEQQRLVQSHHEDPSISRSPNETTREKDPAKQEGADNKSAKLFE